MEIYMQARHKKNYAKVLVSVFMGTFLTLHGAQPPSPEILLEEPPTDQAVKVQAEAMQEKAATQAEPVPASPEQPTQPAPEPDVEQKVQQEVKEGQAKKKAEEAAIKEKVADQEQAIKEKKAAQEKEAKAEVETVDKKKAAEDKNAKEEVVKEAEQKKEIAAPELAPVVPQPVQPEVVTPAPTPIEPVEEESTIDTIDLEEGGNWLLKRKALEKTVDIIESINILFTKILEKSTDYKVQRNNMDNDLERFMRDMGFELGDINQVFTILQEDLEKEREAQGDLSAGERDMEATLDEKKKQVTTLQEDLSKLLNFDNELDTIIDTIDKQIKVCNTYQGQAWRNFQTIKKILSDEKAQELAYKTDILYQNMQDVERYLNDKLYQYFKEQQSEIQNLMTTVKREVEELKEKGIDLRKMFAQLQEEDKEKEEEREKEAQEEKVQKEEQAVQQPIGTTWYNQVFNVLTWPFDVITKAAKRWFS